MSLDILLRAFNSVRLFYFSIRMAQSYEAIQFERVDSPRYRQLKNKNYIYCNKFNQAMSYANRRKDE